MIQIKKLKAAGVDDQLIRQLAEAWKAFHAAKNQTIRQTPHIVCTGIYNAGKSTLLNALTDSEQFPTGNIPTTKEITEVTYEGAVYVDTPGLNAENTDDQKTAAAYQNADLILFVSNAQNGGLLESETEWLRQLQKRFLTVERLNERLIFVISQCGQVDEDQLPAIQEKFQEDISSVFGVKPQTLFQTDALIYIQGSVKNEAPLVEFSHIQELRAYLGSTEKAEYIMNNNEYCVY